MELAPAAWAVDGPGGRFRSYLQRFGLHPGGTWSLSWIALFAGGVWLDPAQGVAPCIGAAGLSTLFAGLTCVGAFAFADRQAPLWILPAALGFGLARGVVCWVVGPAVGDTLSLAFEPGAVAIAAAIVLQADLLEDERILRTLLVLSLLTVAALEAVDSLASVEAAIPDPRAVWYAVAPLTAFLEVGAMWSWIARREVRIERAEDGRRMLENAVARERHVNALLRRKEAWLFDFFEKAPELLLVLAPGTGEILRCSRRLSESLGYARRDLIGRRLLDLVEPASAGPVRSILEARRRHMRNLLLHLRRRDGNELIVLANLAERSDLDGGEEVRAVLQDVTHLEQQVGTDLGRTVAEHVAAGLFHSDDQGHCVLVNASFCELTGLTRERAREQSWLRSVHSEDRLAVERAWNQSVRERVVFRFEHRLRNPTGENLRVVTECIPLPDEQGGGFAGSMMWLSAGPTASRGSTRRPREAVPADSTRH